MNQKLFADYRPDHQRHGTGDQEIYLEEGMSDYLNKSFSQKGQPVSVDELPPRLDRQKLDVLRTLQPGDGGQALVRKLVEIYLRESTHLVETLGQHVEAGMAEKAGEIAHKLKSSTAQLGGIRLAGLCQQVEKLGKTGHVNDGHSLLVELNQEFKWFAHALREEIS